MDACGGNPSSTQALLATRLHVQPVGGDIEAAEPLGDAGVRVERRAGEFLRISPSGEDSLTDQRREVEGAFNPVLEPNSEAIPWPRLDLEDAMDRHGCAGHWSPTRPS